MPRAKKKTTPVKKPSRKIPAKKSPVKKRAKKPVVLAPVPVPLLKLVSAWLTPARIYAFASLAILLASACYWALLGARIHMSNSDQLVSAYLFDDSRSFHGAQWPEQHTFLLKWPVFLAIRLFGASPRAFTAFTIGIVLATVGLLALIMYRIERRPLAFGTLCLALASVLLLVPTQPYPGGILPVNMAMITTRNIEYLVFIAALAALVYTPRLRHWKFGTAVGLLIILIASDKLFLTLGAGGACMAIVAYALARRWALVQLSVRWLAASMAGIVGATTVLWLINLSGQTHIVSGSLTGPYGLVHSAKDILQGSVYMALGLLSNMGANPAADTRLLATVPGQVRDSLLSPQGIALTANGLLLLGVLAATGKLLWSSLVHYTDRLDQDKYYKISLMLMWTTAAACVVFVGSKHYYPVDARYVAIVTFAAFIGLATVGRSLPWRPRLLVVIGMVFGLSIIAGVMTVNRAATAESDAMAATNKRTELITNAINQHNIESLVGDYWRVMPVKIRSTTNLHVVPLSSCTQPSPILTSTAWQPDLNKQSFAYLLTFDRSLTGYTPCSLDQVVQQYGHPNTSTLIAGTLKDPREVLLFYDRGAHNSAPHLSIANRMTAVSTVVPTGIDDLPYTACQQASVMNVVAHQDDDLLFMSPDVLHDVQTGHCVRTVYVTSGDAGAGKYYWVGRERGSEAAYSRMLGIRDIWVERLVGLAGGQFVTVASPRNDPRISLVFMYLPDGNVRGQGFETSSYESLEQLEDGRISQIHTVDRQSVYDTQSFTDTLATLMRIYKPTEIHTQSSFASAVNTDHSDHMSVGRFTQRAYDTYLQSESNGTPPPPLKFYIGYPIRGMEANVSGTDQQAKEQAFFEYAQFDNGVCHSVQQCMNGSNYGAYLSRQYQSDH